MSNNKKISVCYIVSSLCNEGPVNVMYNIIKYIDLDRFDVSIITLIPEKKTTRIVEFKKLPISIYQLAEFNSLNLWKLFHRLRKKVSEVHPDMLHAHCPRSLYLMCFLNKRFKRIYTIHIYPGLQQKILYGNIKGSIVVSLNNFFTKKCDLPIGCAESVGSLYMKYKGWKIMSIPNGCSLPLWNYNENEKKILREKFGMKKDLKYFIYIGRFSHEKNPNILIDAFNQLERKDIGLLMLGDGPIWKELKPQANENIILPGFKTNIYEYLIASDFYVSASDVEGLANTLLESMTVGLPLLLSDIPSHREVLSKTNENIGYIFENQNLSELKDKINSLIEIDTFNASSIIKNVFFKYYRAEIMSKQYQDAYINLKTQQLDGKS